MQQVFCSFFWCVAFVTFQADCTDHVKLGFDYSFAYSGPIWSNETKQKLLIDRLRNSGVTRVKLFTSEALDVVRFVMMWGSSELKLMLAVPNSEMLRLARGLGTFDEQRLWLLTSTVLLYRDKIEYLALGNEVDFPAQNNFKYFPSLVPALEAVRGELERLNISHVKLTSPLSGAIASGSGYANLEVHKAFFVDEYDSVIGCKLDWCMNHKQVPVRKYLLPLLDFLNRTNAPFVINLYPLFQYRATQWPACQLTDSCFNMTLEFATGAPGADPLVDVASGIKYRSLLELTLDGTRAALAKLGYDQMPVILGETGWPTQGAPMASRQSACEYMNSLVSVLNTGTPSAPGVPVRAYFFEWVDEVDKKAWSGGLGWGEVENHWGFIGSDMQPKFPLDFVNGGADCSSIPASQASFVHHPQLLASDSSSSSSGILPWAAAAGICAAVFFKSLVWSRGSRTLLGSGDPEGQYVQLG